MELQNQEDKMPAPTTNTHGGGNMNHHILPPEIPKIPSNGLISSAIEENSQEPLFKKVVKYRECLKNHAATMGVNAIDGCGEFMPNGEEGSLEALTCSACNCHRNFHRKEVEGENTVIECFTHYHHHHHHHHLNRGVGRKVLLGHPHHKGILGSHGVIPSRGAQPHQMIMSSYNYKYKFTPMSSDQSGEQEDNEDGVIMARPINQMVKKRFRTKFTHEQKEKMLRFAEKVEWKIQKQEESVVQQFCQEIGVKKRVLKVWMHNNKHILAKNNDSISNN